MPLTYKCETPMDSLWKETSNIDTPMLLKNKIEMTKDTKPIQSELKYVTGYHYLWRQSLFAEQMMHFTQFSLPSNTLSFFTTGSPNTCVVVNNSYHNKGKDVGKAYMVFGYTDTKQWFNPFFWQSHIC